LAVPLSVNPATLLIDEAARVLEHPIPYLLFRGKKPMGCGVADIHGLGL
jgi:hypothetical protein